MKKNKRFAQENPGRTLIYFPIVHTAADMGALRESVQQATLRKFGRKTLKRKTDLINELWEKIGNKIEELALNYENVRLYEDGLPICGKESKIVSELAEAGSPNHRLLLRLVERGAKLMGTESSELLMKEYGLIKQMMIDGTIRGIGKISSSSTRRLGKEILIKRDRFIADRIAQTLWPGETGMLFLGALHEFEGRLPKDIRVVYPLYKPLNQGGK